PATPASAAPPARSATAREAGRGGSRRRNRAGERALRRGHHARYRVREAAALPVGATAPGRPVAAAQVLFGMGPGEGGLEGFGPRLLDVEGDLVGQPAHRPG